MRLYTLDGKCNISGERIKSARTKAKLTQDQLAARLQVAGLQMGQMAISRIESGKRLVPDFELPIIAEASSTHGQPLMPAIIFSSGKSLAT